MTEKAVRKEPGPGGEPFAGDDRDRTRDRQCNLCRLGRSCPSPANPSRSRPASSRESDLNSRP